MELQTGEEEEAKASLFTDDMVPLNTLMAKQAKRSFPIRTFQLDINMTEKTQPSPIPSFIRRNA